MKHRFEEDLEIPAGIICTVEGNTITCKKDALEIKKKIHLPGGKIKKEDTKLIFQIAEGNKNDWTKLRSTVAHMKNVFLGLEKPFVYALETCNVHFPMTLKADSTKLTINNFLGEKIPRIAHINPEVKVEIQGSKITVTSHDREAAGQTAANIEKATKVRNRDRRIFQDGIFIVKKPGVAA